MFDNLKIRDFTVSHYLKWRTEISKMDLALKTKNGYYKFFKNLLNYGTKWHDFNFAPIYNKMEKFNDPNALPKEMDFYTFEEFQKFMSVIDDIKFKALFKTLYFCGLRRGELRGLSWDSVEHITINELRIKTYLIKEKGKNRYYNIPNNRI